MCVRERPCPSEYIDRSLTPDALQLLAFPSGSLSFTWKNVEKWEERERSTYWAYPEGKVSPGSRWTNARLQGELCLLGF